MCTVGRAGEIPSSSLVQGGHEILDKILVGYGLKSSDGTKFASVDGMISYYQESVL